MQFSLLKKMKKYKINGEKNNSVERKPNTLELKEKHDSESAVHKKTELKELPRDEDNSLESVLSELKLFGRFHLQLYLLISLSAIFIAPHSINYIFAVENVKYRCKQDKCDKTDLLTLGPNSTVDDKCYKYQLLDPNGTCTDNNIDETSAADCTEWVYEKPNSFVAEFNLGCEDWKRTLVGTMHSVGNMIGLIIMSPMSDKIGRKKVLIFNILTRGVLGVAKSMLTSYWLYITLEMFESMFGDSYGIIFTMAVEMVTKNDRPKVILLLSVCTTTGQILIATIAYFAPTWRILLLCLYAPAFLFIPYVFWINESLRWLLSKGKKSEAEKIIRKAFKTNKRPLDDSRIINLNCEDSSSASAWKSIKDTLASKKLLIRLLICFSMWFTSLFNAYSLLINSVSLEGNKYINFGLVALCGTVAGIILYYVLTKFKRKGPMILALTLTGVFCMAQAFVPKGYKWLSILFYLCSKMNATISLRIAYLYTSELFPTYTRNTMLGLCSSMGRAAVIIAPQTPLLLKYWIGLPTLLMGVLALMTASVVTLMPDTSEDVLPDNVKQAEALGVRLKEKEISTF